MHILKNKCLNLSYKPLGPGILFEDFEEVLGERSTCNEEGAYFKCYNSHCSKKHKLQSSYLNNFIHLTLGTQCIVMT